MLARRLAEIRAAVGDEAFAGGHFEQAGTLFEQVALADEYVDFLTLPAYEHVVTGDAARSVDA